MEQDNVSLTSTRPYLIRAIRDWAVDNGLTPQLLVDATVEGVQVPSKFVEDGRIILNVDANAVVDLYLGNDEISFKTLFQGQSMEVLLPLSCVMAIFARENNQGYFFQDDTTKNAKANNNAEDQASAKAVRRSTGRPSLKLVE